VNINDPEFIGKFDMAKGTVGQVGYGFIGNAVVELFRPYCDVIVYDKAGYAGRQKPPRVGFSDSIDTLVRNCEVIFVAVPTPMKPSGECHTDIVESVMQDIQNVAIKIGRSLNDFVVVLKSTVPPGFTQKMQDKYALRLVFSPEFLTEASAVRDFKTTNRVILGGDVDDARIVFKYFEGVWPTRVFPSSAFDPQHPDGPVQIVQCDSTVAEMVKLSTNIHLTSKVMISNELYLICQKLGIPYDDVKLLTQLDRRIGTSHMSVPGPDGHLGYGGHCFVKDTQNLAFISNQLGISTHVIPNQGQDSLFRSLHQRNLAIREDRDWEAQKGRAVIDE
jgi:nucleotide sugar dehydrogenase